MGQRVKLLCLDILCSMAMVTNEEYRVIADKLLPNDLSKIAGLLLSWSGELAGVVVESTCNWYWLVDVFQEAGLVVKLASTADL